MWVPVLLAGAAIAGILIAKKMSEGGSVQLQDAPPPGTPDVPRPPPGVINISASQPETFMAAGADVPAELVWVRFVAMSLAHPDRTYVGLKSFPSLELATKYYEAMGMFFEQYHSWWTCPGGTVEIDLWGFGNGDTIPRSFDRHTFSCADLEVAQGASVEQRPPDPPTAVGLAPTIPLYIVMMTISGSVNTGEQFTFRSDAEAETYYRLLKAFFDQSVIRQAYTFPVGSIVLLKYGTKPSVSRAAVYSEGGLIGEEP